MPHISDIATVQFDPSASELIPKSMVHEYSVIPVMVIGDALRVIIPTESETSRIADKLQFIINMPIIVDTGERDQIDALIHLNYPMDPPIQLPAALPEINRETDFVFLDLVGNLTHSTAASVSFNLGTKSDYLEQDDGTRSFLGKNRVFHIIGWLDAHYPCNGYHKLLIRCSLPNDYISYETMRDIIPCVIQALELPDEVSYDIHLFSSQKTTSMVNPINFFT